MFIEQVVQRPLRIYKQLSRMLSPCVGILAIVQRDVEDDRQLLVSFLQMLPAERQAILELLEANEGHRL